jgi:hypothetical protein
MTTLTRREQIEARRLQEAQAPEARADEEFLDDIYGRIGEGNVLPILGGAVRLRRIFGLEHTHAGAAAAAAAAATEPATESNAADNAADNAAPAAAPQEGMSNPDGTLPDGIMPDVAAAAAAIGKAAAEATGYESDANTEPESKVFMDLSEQWAEKLGYPLKESRNLARVAQYNRVMSRDVKQEKKRFLTFLKESILNNALQYDSSVTEQVTRLKEEDRSSILSFADIVTELDYPRYIDRPDPLRILARFRLPVYVTTSYFDFVERALKAEGVAKVRTQFCLWNMEPELVAPEYRPDPNYLPTREEPLVYHLFGLERYPQSMVLSEEDYLDFVLAIARDYDTEKHLLPLQLKSRLEECSLLLMGYRLADWEFRVLFRGLINLLHGALKEAQQTYSIAIQLDPHFQEQVVHEERAREYLERYFEKARFQVVWMSTDDFIDRLWQYFKDRRMGVI